jgi:hypothetical protein
MTGLVGHTLQSCTRVITIIKGYLPEFSPSDIYFIDTPGLDDDEKSEEIIFKELSDWLIKAYISPCYCLPSLTEWL